MKDKRGVQLVKLDWDKECRYDFLTGKGFEVTQPAFNKNNEKNKYGVQSPLFGSDWSDEDAFAEMYSCRCGELRGKVFSGETCPICKTEVEYRDVDLSITGWIMIDNFKLIQPVFYKKIASIIGNKQFKEIIEFNKKVKRDGELELIPDAKNPFKGIGIIEFHDRFDEIMEFFVKKKKNKIEAYEEIMDEREKVFTSCIPVYSAVLRPVVFKGDSFFYTPIGKKYNIIFSLTRLLNDTDLYDKRKKKWDKEKRERMDYPNIVGTVQTKLMELWDLVFAEIEGKEGDIKSNILGGMINYSSRC